MSICNSRRKGNMTILKRRCRLAGAESACLVLVIGLLAAPLPAGLAAEPPSEYQTKATFLYHFAEFTEWPAEAFADKDSPIVVGVLSADPFGRSLDQTMRGQSVRGRRLAVERYRRVEDIKKCHILFI